MKCIIAGGRDFDKGFAVIQAVKEFESAHGKITEVVCGMCRGADMMGWNYANIWGIPIKEFPADWDRYGNSAGVIRNKEMAEYAKGGGAIIFWDGKSKGASNMIDLSAKYRLNTKVVLY